jgi:hypothetical protein
MARATDPHGFLLHMQAHCEPEALVREWKRPGNWLREAREDIIIQKNVSEDAAAWAARNNQARMSGHSLKPRSNRNSGWRKWNVVVAVDIGRYGWVLLQ